MALFNRKQIVARAKASTTNVPGTCQKWTREIIGAPSAGDRDGDGDADAVDGWKSEPPSKREISRDIPYGYPVAWSGGANGFGHRAISLGGGLIRSTDAGGRGRVATVDLGWVERNWGLKYLGWSRTMTGLDIPDAPKPKPKPLKSKLEVLSYNVQIGKWAEDLTEILRLVKQTNPDLVFLYEASNLEGHLNVPGYDAFQLKDRPKRRGSQPNQAGVALLVKKQLVHGSPMNIVMRKFWRGPKHGLLQDPRVYRWIRVKKNGVIWAVGGFHLPFGASARAESFAKMRLWFKNTVPGRPKIAVSDFNGNKANAEKNVGDAVGANVVGRGVDLALYKNCVLLKQEVLQAKFNDHPVMDWTFGKF